MPKRRMYRHAVTQPLDQSYRLIALTKGQNAIVDAADYKWLNQWNWCAFLDHHTKTYRPIRRVGDKKILMYRALLECSDSEEVDHGNHDTLDNRRTNISICTPEQNAQNHQIRKNNSSGAVGVCWSKKTKKWAAAIMSNGKRIWIGYFHTVKEAANAYDKAAKKNNGEFAYLNSHLHPVPESVGNSDPKSPTLDGSAVPSCE